MDYKTSRMCLQCCVKKELSHFLHGGEFTELWMFLYHRLNIILEVLRLSTNFFQDCVVLANLIHT